MPLPCRLPSFTAATPEIAKDNLINAGWGLDEIQAKAILELRLQRLTGMERDKIKDEYDNLMKLIAHLQELLDTESLRFELIKKELIEVKEKFGTPRLSDIQYMADEMRIEDLIEKEDVIITISHLGYIKRTSATEYRQQKRGGRGAIGSKTRQEDFVEHLFVASTHDIMMFFTQKGRCYWLKVYEIPEGEKQAKGRAIQNMVQLLPDDKVKAILNVKDLEDKDFVSSHNIVLCTRKGVIKKTQLQDFSRPRITGVNAITILEGDELLDARLTDGNCEIMMAVKSGRAIRFPEEKVRTTGRGAIGVTGIEVDDNNDEVIGMICVNRADAGKTVLVVSEKGFGKRTAVDDYRITNRGGKGVKTINVTEKTGKLIGILDVTGTEDLIITCESGITLRTSVTDIKEAGRNTQGVKLIRLSDVDEIAAISKLDVSDEEIDAAELEEENNSDISVESESNDSSNMEDSNNDRTPESEIES